MADQSIGHLSAADVIGATGNRLLDPGYLFCPRGVFLEGEGHEPLDLLHILGVLNLVLLVPSNLLHSPQPLGSRPPFLDAQQDMRKLASLSLP